MKTLLCRWVACIAVLVLFTSLGTVRAEDDRDRKARAALALTTEAQPVKDRDRDARVALAFASQTVKPTVIFTAPPPKAKAGCACGPFCDCCGCCDKCPPATSAKPSPRDSLVRVTVGNGSGSGTVIWSANGRSVILTAAHVVTIGPEPRVRALAKWHAAKLLARDEAADLAALVVEVELPAVPVSESDPQIGAAVEMFGVTSLWSKGKITASEGSVYLLGCDTGPEDYSDSGDSGGGVFVRNELVGVHCGKFSQSRSPYCAATKPIRTFLAKVFRRDGSQVVLIEPVAAKPAQKAATTKPDEYDLWLIQGRYYYVPKGTTPNFGGSSCPNGRCPLQK